MRTVLIALAAVVIAGQAHAGVCSLFAGQEACDRAEARHEFVRQLRQEMQDQEDDRDRMKRIACEPITTRDADGRLHESYNLENCGRY